MLLGLCALLQGTFLHGFLVLHFLGIRQAGVLPTWILSFSLSVTANYLIVTLLVAIGAYVPAVVYGIFAAELALAAWVCRARLARPAGAWLGNLAGQYSPFAAWFRAASFSNKACAGAGLLLALWCVYPLLLAPVRKFGTIFTIWDDVVSWNHWATMWAANGFPRETLSYPQLLPALWSLTYVFQQDTVVQFFAKAVMPLFPLSILLVYLDLGLRQKRPGYLFSVFFAAVILHRFMGPYVYEGFADIPVGFMGLASIYALLLAAEEPPERRAKYLLAGALIVAGCAHTKQVGLYLGALYPVLAFVLTADRISVPGLRGQLPALLRVAVLTAVLVVPWYVVVHWQMWMGTNTSNIYDLVVTEHAGRSLLIRMQHAASLLAEPLGNPKAVFLLLAAALAIALFDRQWRWLVALVVVPFYIIWSLLFSYDLRTLAFIMPLAGGVAGVAAWQAWAWVARPIATLLGRASGGVYLLAGIACVLLIASSPRFDGDVLRARQLEKQRAVGEASVNEQVYRQYEILPGKILTNYTMLQAGFLPGLEKQAIDEDFRDLATLRRKLLESAPTYLLARVDILDNSEVVRFIEGKVKSGDYALLYRKEDGRQFLFVRILRP